MITPKFSFELPEAGVTLDDEWSIGYSFGIMVIIKNGERHSIRVVDALSDDGKVVYDLDADPVRVTGGAKKLTALWYQDVVLGKGDEEDARLSKMDIVKVYEKGKKV